MTIIKGFLVCSALFGVYCILAIIYGEIRHKLIIRKLNRARKNCCGSEGRCRAIKPCYTVKLPRKFGTIKKS